MTTDHAASLQTIYEQLVAALYDITEGNPADAIPALEDCIDRLNFTQTTD
jgi:hypothetical protein